MRLFRFGPPGQERPGAFDRDGVRRDISSLIADLRGEWLHPGALARLSSLDLTSLPQVSDGERLGPCVAAVGHFLAVGLNFANHAAESHMEAPKEPIIFTKAPSCLSGPDDRIVLPPGSEKTDWEVELAVVIGKDAAYIDEEAARDVIAGYCICNDVSERAYQLERGGGQWVKGKGCPTFGPLGPWLVTPDEIEDVQSLSMWLDVNGVRMQNGSTSQMIFGVHQLIAHISQFMNLRAGDVICTGTPEGVGLGMKPPRYLKEGDEVQLGIEGLGCQRQLVVAHRGPAGR
ncbi:MAG: 2-hydroxyhepta-2,4-diene,7-dioate isomerase [Caulobacteraceae bacterium]|jgi:2,4-diketo-3-deoxy-L-fuconate hydrolase|nr:2-hydroxyhepta-2,4-diene,7-dioate isomerase [Caulobacteraceae bacterium]